MASRLRVFVTTSHISSVYMTLHARATHQSGDRDVLLVDIGTRRVDVVKFIRKTAELHDWSIVQSFSDEVDDAHRFEPSLAKRLTRQWKELPVLRSIYSAMLRRFERSRDERLSVAITAMLAPFVEGTEGVEVFGHTQTHLNKLIARMYPNARMSFFEHGLGDYHYIEERGRLQGPLFALFADGFKRFLDRRGVPSGGVSLLDIQAEFHSVASGQVRAYLPPESVIGNVPVDKPLVLILLEAVDMYEVPQSFWGAYIDHALAVLDEPSRFHFLLKPHPIASASSLAGTEAHCRRIGLSYTLLDEPWQKSMAAEVMFAAWADRTQHVFCLFSSACFYLSQLYRDPRITYHYSTGFMDRWTANAPPMYKRHFDALKPLISEVLAERCVPY